MNKGLIFLCLACGLLALTIVTICVAPLITGVLDASEWAIDNCQVYADDHKIVEDRTDISNDKKDKLYKYLDKGKHLCERRKAMHGLEYASLISDLVFGFSCTLLSLLHFFGVGKPFEKITGLIGLISGIIGFILTLIYIIYSGYIFTHDNDNLSYENDPDNIKALDPDNDLNPYSRSSLPKLDKDRKIAEWNNDKTRYECLYFKEDDFGSVYTKYNDLGKRQYNYHKDFSIPDANSDYKKCKVNFAQSGTPIFNSGSAYDICKSFLEGKGKSDFSNCNEIYYENDDTESINEIYNKYQYDKWVTSIIFGCFIILLNLGLAIFGFLMFKESDGTSGLVALK